jgi:hypothetical protein
LNHPNAEYSVVVLPEPVGPVHEQNTLFEVEETSNLVHLVLEQAEPVEREDGSLGASGAG